MVTAHARAVGGVDDAGAGRATMISVSRFLGARSCSSSSGRSLGQVHFTKPSRWHLSSRLGTTIAVRLRSATTRHSHAHPELDRNAFLPRCAAAAASWAWAGGWGSCRRAWNRPESSAAVALDVLGDWRPSLPSRHSVFLSVSVALALACRGEGAWGAAQAPWRYVRSVSGHHRLLMTDVSTSELTVLQGCVQVQVEVGGSWRDGGDDGALAFLPLSPPPR